MAATWRLDARAAWGESDNSVNALGLFEDALETERWLLRGRLTGSLQRGNWRIAPGPS